MKLKLGGAVTRCKALGPSSDVSSMYLAGAEMDFAARVIKIALGGHDLDVSDHAAMELAPVVVVAGREKRELDGAR